MAHELTPWKQEGCSITVEVGRLSRREPFSREINEAFGEGGGLNADYRTVDAAIVAAAALGKVGLDPGVDFVWKTVSDGKISFDFKDPLTRNIGKVALGMVTTVERMLMHHARS